KAVKMEENWVITQSTCKRCGSCIDLCPNRIIQKDSTGKVDFRQDRLWMCFHCGHCMAICPTQSIHVPGLTYDKDFYPQPKLDGHENEQFVHLISSRRAVRSFLDKPVPHELLDKVVQAIRSAPPGFPPIKTELTVIEDPEKLHQALPMMIDLYAYLIKAMGNPIARQFVRKSAGREKYITVKNHVIPMMVNRMPDLRSGKEDTIMRRAPALILFHADRNGENYVPDIYLALTYGILAAHSLGLGATAMDLIPPAVEKSKQLRDFFKIPENNEIVASMILGYPKHPFLRGIRRELKSVTWL
ncbi:MAG TPA: nitroreductase family protein, partial [Longilinea sp.]|nr:nitroreductase family protein [Longilinea sp.]